MALPGPLRSELLRYRKRKHLSLDGGIPGAMYARRGGTPPSVPLPPAATGQLYEQPLPGEYVPQAGHMHLSGPRYDPPDFIQGSGPPPSPQLGGFSGGNDSAGPPDLIPGPVSYETMLMVDRAVEEIHQERQALHDEACGIARPDGLDAQPVDEMFHAPTQPTDGYGYAAGDMTRESFEQEMALANDATSWALPTEAIGEPGAPSQVMQDAGLEAIVNDAAPAQPAPDELQPDPYLIDPFEDPLMRQMMDPFGIPGMGPM
jgi:hypothetical protein